MVVQPAARDVSEAVEMSDTGLCENRRQHISDDAPDSMACKDLQYNTNWKRISIKIG